MKQWTKIKASNDSIKESVWMGVSDFPGKNIKQIYYMKDFLNDVITTHFEKTRQSIWPPNTNCQM